MRLNLHRAAWPDAVLFLFLVAFIAFKTSFLNLPFYWDEAWVYAPAVKSMAEHGPSLLPDALPPELSRGHPLLFHAMGGSWVLLIGGSHVSLHLFTLSIAVILCVATYRLGCMIGSRLAGLASVLLILSNECFLTQSGLLLPETSLTLFIVLALLGHLNRKAWLYISAGTCALLTKESALTLVLALLGVQVILVSTMRERSAIVRELRWTVILLLPLVPALAFFALQKAMLGWYLYPEHLGMITWGIKEAGYKAKLVFTASFERQGMLVLTYSFFFIGTLLNIRLPLWLRLLSAFLFVAAIKVLFGRWELPGVLTLAVPAMCFVIIAFTFFRRQIILDRRRGELITSCFMVCMALWAFTALNFYTDRYLLMLVPVIAVGALALMHGSLERWHASAAPLIGIAIAVYLGSQIGTDGRIGDTRLSYRDAIEVHRNRIEYCEARGLYDTRIYCSFMDTYYMTEPDAGYLAGGRIFNLAANSLEPDAEIAFVGYDSPLELRPELIAKGFLPTARFEQASAWAEVLERP